MNYLKNKQNKSTSNPLYNMDNFNIGIVGAGMIAKVIAKAIAGTKGVTLSAIASRRVSSANDFAKEFDVPNVFETWQELVASKCVDGIYIATPTIAKEEIALIAASKQKHLLVDKPFSSYESVVRMTAAAKEHGVLFMDATHFTNNYRTTELKRNVREQIGEPQVVRSTFFFPFSDPSNIRFDLAKEPTGGVGDTGWYCMRAIVEYLQPSTSIKDIHGGIIRDESGAIQRGFGYVLFEDGKSSTFNFGYNVGVLIQECDIMGTKGMINVNDFVLDWKNGFTFDDQDHKIGYTLRSEMNAQKDFQYVVTDSDEPQAFAMVRHFATLAKKPESSEAKMRAQVSLQTQQLLDAFWNIVKDQ